MKGIMKQLLALSLALIVAFTFTPITTQAAGKKVTVARSGKVKTVMYKGGKARTGSFSMTSTKSEYTYILVDGRFQQQDKYTADQPSYNKFEVVTSVKFPKLKKNDIIKTVQEINKKNYSGKYYVFAPVIIDSKGNSITDIKYDEHIDGDTKDVSAKQGRKRYYLWNYKGTLTIKYTMYVPVGRTDINVGFAGLRNGQMKKKTYKAYKNDNSKYYQAGFGNKKKGYIIAGSIF